MKSYTLDIGVTRSGTADIPPSSGLDDYGFSLLFFISTDSVLSEEDTQLDISLSVVQKAVMMAGISAATSNTLGSSFIMFTYEWLKSFF